MEELTKNNGKGIWMREIEKMLRRFNASLEWLMESENARGRDENFERKVRLKQARMNR